MSSKRFEGATWAAALSAVLLTSGCIIETGDSGSTPSGAVTWSTNATSYRGRNGLRFVFACPFGGTARSVWGTDIYTDDSSVCTAAVHAGLISFSGGSVTIEIRPGLSQYAGSVRNGVSSSNYGVWSGSFVFVP